MVIHKYSHMLSKTKLIDHSFLFVIFSFVCGIVVEVFVVKNISTYYLKVHLLPEKTLA